jgi:calcium-dependent protein kinase
MVHENSDTPRGADGGVTPRGQHLGIIAERMSKHTQARISLVGRCHSAPERMLEQDYAITSKVLGTGYSGSVRLATSKRGNGNQAVAVKTFSLRGLNAKKKLRLHSEIEVFLSMDHPHVARLLDVYETDFDISLVMECAAGGELYDRVKKVKCFPEQEAADAMRQILLAVNYLHSRGMVHRDLKLENFLYDTKDSNYLKMIDFGFSKYTGRESRMRTSCGTLAYVAPEVLKRTYTSKCDLWSVGVITFVLLSGTLPFGGENSEDQMDEIKHGSYSFKPKYWDNVTQNAKEFIKALLQVNPDKRIDSRAALQHRWIVGHCSNNNVMEIDAPVIDAIREWRLAPKLQRACMSLAAWSLTNEQHAVVRGFFLALDTDHDGAISPIELKETMMQKLQMSEDKVEEVLRALDGSHINYSDFLAAMSMSTHISLDDDVLQTTFAKFDMRGTGYITSSDLRGVLGDSFEGEYVEALVKQADLNSDGRLDFQEFSKCTQNQNYHPGTLLIRSGPAEVSHLPHIEENAEKEEKDVRVVQFAQAGAQHNACCVMQ